MNRNVSYGESQIHVETVLPKGGTARGRSGQPVVSDISLSTTYHAESAADHRARFGVRDSRVYTRFGHPNLEEVAARIALLEHAEAGLVFPSGMSAVTTTVLTFLRKGDHAIVQEDTFAQTRSFATRLPDQFGIDIDFVDATDPDRVKRALKDNTALIWIDTPANPTLSVVDIHAVATIGQERGIPVCVDSTFASPYLQNPLTLGASVVMHSGTKYLSGHSDTMCGAIASDARTIARIKETQIVLGGILDPFAAWRLNKGIKTLALRVQRQSDNALEIAEFLESHDRVRAVYYPYLKTHKNYQVAREQMRGGGGVVSFELASAEAARRFVDSLKLIPIATSLGGVETMIEVPYDLDFGAEQLGSYAESSVVKPGLIRLAVGIERAADLCDDLASALKVL